MTGLIKTNDVEKVGFEMDLERWDRVCGEKKRHLRQDSTSAGHEGRNEGSMWKR